MGDGRARGTPHQRQPRFLSAAELAGLLTSVARKAEQARRTGSSRPVTDELIVLLLAEMGLRASELCALRIGDLPPVDGRNEVWIRPFRGNRGRAMKISPKTGDTLWKYVRLYRRGAKPNDPLFLSERGTPFSYMSLYSKVRKLGREGGVVRLSPGVLRRTFLVSLYGREQDLRLVQEQAGHASVKTTARFLRARAGQQPRAHPADDGASDRTPMAVVCDACARRTPRTMATRIDSGQVLCPDCLRDLRST